MNLPNCPLCNCDFTYELNDLIICPMCNHEFTIDSLNNEVVIKDAFNNILSNGDTISIIKDLKVKGSSQVIKIGTKVKNIRLDYESSDDHNINCKIDGFGEMRLISSFVKKI